MKKKNMNLKDNNKNHGITFVLNTFCSYIVTDVKFIRLMVNSLGSSTN